MGDARKVPGKKDEKGNSMKAFIVTLCAVTALLLLMNAMAPAGPEAGEQEMVTVIAITGPCSCTALVYVAGAVVDEDRCMWKVHGDTLSIFIPVIEK